MIYACVGSKRGPVTSKPLKKIPAYPVDEAGKPVLPLKVGILTLNNIGTIVWDNPAFHSSRYIYPVGFEITRPFGSAKNPSSQTLYTCRIKNNNGAPRFEIVAEDDPETVYSQATSTGAWTSVMREVNRVRNKEGSNSASGPDYFGYSNPTILKLIQELPNARKCANYVWQVGAHCHVLLFSVFVNFFLFFLFFFLSWFPCDQEFVVEGTGAPSKGANKGEQDDDVTEGGPEEGGDDLDIE